MNYQVLARKWRPRLFSQMVGQTHVLRALSNALDQDRLHHAYLFTGTRGVGKTTIARIFAKCLNCVQGVSSKPCNQCEVCTAVDEGRFVDLIEVDAASRSKVDQTRELMDNVQYTPTMGRYKVYLIDEVHMFSDASFNSLLKTLEEPPPHIQFLLATTEHKKIPITILSRCLQFNLSHLSVGNIVQQLEIIMQQEKIQYEPSVLSLIAEAAQGSMRDALSLLDQAIAYADGELKEAEIGMMLGTIHSADLYGILQALIDQDITALLKAVDHMASYEANYETVLEELLKKLQQIAVLQILPAGEQFTERSYEPELIAIAKKIDKETVQLYYQIVLNGKRDVVYTADIRSSFEMILIRMLAFKPLTVDEMNSDASIQVSAEVGATGSSGELGATEVTSEWAQMISQMSLNGPVSALAKSCVIKEHTEQKLVLARSSDYDHMMICEDDLIAQVSQHLGQQVTIIVDDKIAEPTPVEQEVSMLDQKKKQAEEALNKDPLLNSIIDTFDARVDKESIEPR